MSRILAYFDTNIFDNLLKRTGGVTDEDEAQLRVAISTGRLSILPGFLVLQETLGARISRRPEIVLPQLGLIASLTDWSRFVKPHNIILEEDIRHFAWNGEPASPFVGEHTVKQLRSNVQRLLNGTKDIDELNEDLVRDREQKEGFLRQIQDLSESVSEQTELLRDKDEIPDFADYFREGVEEFALAFAESLGVANQCKERGIAKLVKIASVRAFLGFAMSLVYRRVVERKMPRIGAARDLQHVPSAASAASLFVTHDVELRALLDRVPMTDFRPVTLNQMFTEISAGSD